MLVSQAHSLIACATEDEITTKGSSMALLIGSQARVIFVATLAAFCLFWADALRAQETTALPDYVIEQFGTPPQIPQGPFSEELQSAVQVAFVDSMVQSNWGTEQSLALNQIALSKDPRIAWIISDLMRFVSSRQLSAALADAASRLLGKKLQNGDHWGAVTNHLIAWDIPAPPDYLRVKRTIFTSIVPGWERIFVEGKIDWRHVSWGVF